MARHEQDRWDEERAALLSGGVDGLGGSSGDEVGTRVGPTSSHAMLLLERQRLEQQQDEHLDALHASAHRLSEMSRNIHGELAEQERMLREAEEEVQDVTDAVQATNERVQALIRANGGPGWCALLTCMSCTVVVLFLLILWGA